MLVVVIIQARMGSIRLPGKVLKELAGKPVLWHVIDRVKHALLPDEILIATTTNPEDDVIESACNQWGVKVFRGDPEDVLTRYFSGLLFLERNQTKIDYIVRITADCPFIDPLIIDAAIQTATSGKYDYVSNVDPRTYPDGLDVEVMSRSALCEAYENASTQSEHEHVTPYIRNNPLFCKHNLRNLENLSGLRWTLDTEQDFRFIQKIYEALYLSSRIFTTADILTYLKAHPELRNNDTMFRGIEGNAKSLRENKLIQP